MNTGYARSFKGLRVYQKTGSFCGPPEGVLREDATGYFAATPTDDCLPITGH
ncbi:MAG: hypothetical protein ABSF60_12950 [Verrucomicrobiota bacterium]|jgi:hypothetical protein